MRSAVLVFAFLLICRPVVLLPPTNSGDIVVPVLVDASRSMRIEDVDGRSRLAAATSLLTSQIMPALARIGRPELFKVADGLAEASVENLSADGRHTDLVGAVNAARERFRGRRVAGIVVLSDGGDTGQHPIQGGDATGAPVSTIGVGTVEGVPDREVLSIGAGDPQLDQALVDVHVTTLTRGLGKTPYTLRVSENGQLLESRQVTPGADGAPDDQTFQVTPDPLNATVITADVVVDPKETVRENNVRTLLLSPATRKRRLLVLAGSPGYEHSFLVRALSQDPNFEIDSIVRKGKDDSGRDTFLIQATGGRGATLVSGFPPTREALFGYDGVVIGNLEGEFFGQAQIEMLADFVSVRGGGLLVLGSRTFLQRGIAGSPLEEALPVELTDRRGGSTTRAGQDESGSTRNKVMLTPEGALNPIMRIGATADESRRLWADMPALASVAPIGGPRPGATVLAISQASNGASVPLLAVQRYGRGRSMVFSGEASWRWRMMRPSTDRSYELFWRQAARWLSGDAPEPVTIALPDNPAPGEAVAVQVEARNAGFMPVADAAVSVTLTAPGGAQQSLTMRPASTGVQATTFQAETPGLYRVHAEARQGAASLGVADRWLYVGAADTEFADPRLNEPFLRRLARQSGGQYVPAADVERVLTSLSAGTPQTLEPERRDLWHQPWTFTLLLVLLGAEWGLRRLWGCVRSSACRGPLLMPECRL
ncbi:MAG: hypothetical protein U0Q11_13570 [Vicinamibacterales bacterium]